MSWRLFHTAPRDGTAFIVCTAYGIVGEAYWDAEDGQCWWANTDPSGYADHPVDNPRWWQPLPADTSCRREDRAVTYARGTRVPLEKTKTEIETTLARYGADRFAYFTEPTKAIIVFEIQERRVRFDLPLPEGAGHRPDQTRRERWRALLLCIKAKLESVESKIESFEEAFLAHVVMPDGRTVHEHTAPRIAEIAKGGELRPLLPGPREA